MVITLILLAIFAWVALMAISKWLLVANKNYSRNASEWGIATIIVGVIVIIIFITILGTSYDTYLDARAFIDGTNHNCAEAINLYTEKSKEFDLLAETNTDLKYNSYQTSLKELIENYTILANKYNAVVIIKRRFDNNIIFSWLIISPDEDMKIVNIRDLLEK